MQSTSTAIPSVAPADPDTAAPALSNALAAEVQQLRADIDALMRSHCELAKASGLCFNEAAYLRYNPDVAEGVRRGDVASGYAHWQETGFREQRRAQWADSYALVRPHAPRRLLVPKSLTSVAPQPYYQKDALSSPGAWRRLAYHPTGTTEGVAVFDPVRREVWSMGGFPLRHPHTVSIYHVDTDLWRSGPALPFDLHHLFDAALIADDKIIVMGGIKVEGDHHVPNDALLIYDLKQPEHLGAWRVVPAPVGGMISCTQRPVDGKIYGFTGSKRFFAEVPWRFFSFDVKTLEVHLLPAPEAVTTHGAMLVDSARGEILIVCATPEGGQSRLNVDIYNVKDATWRSEPASSLYANFDSRAPLTTPDGCGAWMFGGQVEELSITSGLVHYFDIATQQATAVDCLPHPVFGATSVQVDDAVMLIGGSTSVGDFSTRNVYFWHPARAEPADLLASAELLAAFVGPWQVTDAVRERLRQGATVFDIEQQKHLEDVLPLPATANLKPLDSHAWPLVLVFRQGERIRTFSCVGVSNCLVEIGSAHQPARAPEKPSVACSCTPPAKASLEAALE